jgi:large subunit ribosomal protein L24
MKIQKDDNVIVLTGKDKGKKGTVIQALPEQERVIVEGVNIVKKHQKPTQFESGGIKEIEKSIHVSNVALVDPKEDKATRVGYKRLKDGKKVRIAKRSGETVE